MPTNETFYSDAVLSDHLGVSMWSIVETLRELAEDRQEMIYMVGGAVRDLLRKCRNSGDLDVMASGNGIALALALQASMGGELVTHRPFMTAGIKIGHDEIDIATSRQEYYPYPAALPVVQLAAPEEDLARRDFTIHAMAIALNGETCGQLLDPYGGRFDVEKGNLEVLHECSFQDDPTRLLRAVRYAVRFHFELGANTMRYAQRDAKWLRELTTARLSAELRMLFTNMPEMKSIFDLFHDMKLFEALIMDQVDEDDFKDEYRARAVRAYERLREAFLRLELHPPSTDWLMPLILLLEQSQLSHDGIERLAISKSEKRFFREMKSWGLLKMAADAPLQEWHRRWASADERFVLHVHCSDSGLLDRACRYIVERRKLHQLRVLNGKTVITYGVSAGESVTKWLKLWELAFFEGEFESSREAIVWLETELSRN